MDTNPVGASLLAMTATRSTSMQTDPAPSRAGSLSQGSCGENNVETTPRHCGSELARDDGGLADINAADPPPSRAGSLPQGAQTTHEPEVSA
jgi:hypothetical protein